MADNDERPGLTSPKLTGQLPARAETLLPGQDEAAGITDAEADVLLDDNGEPLLNDDGEPLCNDSDKAPVARPPAPGITNKE